MVLVGQAEDEIASGVHALEQSPLKRLGPGAKAGRRMPRRSSLSNMMLAGEDSGPLPGERERALHSSLVPSDLFSGFQCFNLPQ